MIIVGELTDNNLIVTHFQSGFQFFILILLANQFIKKEKEKKFNLLTVLVVNLSLILYFSFNPEDLHTINPYEISITYAYIIIVFSRLIYKSYLDTFLMRYSFLFFSVVIYFTASWIIFFSFDYFIKAKEYDILIKILDVNNIMYVLFVLIVGFNILRGIQENQKKNLPIIGGVLQKISEKTKTKY
ncbi:hypothetical protein [Aureivirga sp. CE67]|uniref:hypothetical protein n=1 Tax=Aureivirga sp. CE67 TaxID=1788983 RepID=UPI0018CB9EC2|nr:hypothetical protein [Aureivirga sp. CE67]